MSTFTFTELSPISFLERAATVYANRYAIIDGDFTVTYSEMYARALRMAGALENIGLRRGGRVCVLAPNTHMLLEAHYGVPLAGGVVVALDTRLPAAELGYIIRHCGASVVLVDFRYRALLGHALGAMLSPAVMDSEDLESLLEWSPQTRVEVVDERSPLSISYTSGTTGNPKGAIYQHRGAYLQSLAMAFRAKLDTSSRYLWTLPIFHANGWCFPWAVTAAGGLHHCLDKVNPTEIWMALRKNGISHMCTEPRVLAMLADAPDAVSLSSPVRIFVGGAPPWSLVSRVSELGFDVQHLYGLTETFGPVAICEIPEEWSTLPREEWEKRLVRQGIPKHRRESDSGR
ncbi:hypothetical protein BS297_27200 [Rhodococcus erythropolis]|uniref:AMP-dependent synthetase/ligase domain-containing protein n=1 Tax=Rhodococcus erythropolis TaxID=1833 RepID=A0A5N5DWW4_RHOER|nr:hypothetical protein BS297_27200 [Rhodococcus erythropolis]